MRRCHYCHKQVNDQRKLCPTCKRTLKAHEREQVRQECVKYGMTFRRRMLPK